MHYVGMDCHITTLDFAVVNEAGRLVKSHKVPPVLTGSWDSQEQCRHRGQSIWRRAHWLLGR